MNTLLIFYSYSGHTKQLANAKAKELGAELLEVTDVKRPGGLKTLFKGCPAAAGKKSWPINPIDKQLNTYDKFVVMGPIWAGNPAPEVNSIVELIPQGSEVEFIMVSGGGQSSGKDKTIEHAQRHSLKVLGYSDVRG